MNSTHHKKTQKKKTRRHKSPTAEAIGVEAVLYHRFMRARRRLMSFGACDVAMTHRGVVEYDINKGHCLDDLCHEYLDAKAAFVTVSTLVHPEATR